VIPTFYNHLEFRSLPGFGERTMRKLLLVAGLLSSVFALSASAQASFVPAMTGASAFNSGGRIGFANYAVYQNTGNWITDLGLGGLVAQTAVGGGSGPAVTGGERNVFFFQLARTDVNAVGTGDLTAKFGFDPWISGGYLLSTVFSDSDGAVGGVNDLNAGATPTFVLNGASENPTLETVNNFGGGGDFTFNGVTFQAGDTSSVVFFTSNSNPLNPSSPLDSLFSELAFAPGSTTGGGAPLLPTSNPEPGSLILLSFAGLGGAGLTWRRRRKEKQDSGTNPPSCV
jgi:hypothetical protein